MDIMAVIKMTVLIAFGFLNIKIKKRAEQRQLEDRRKAEFDTRPRFEIEEFAQEYDANNKQKILENCELNVLFVSIKEYKKGEYTFDFYYEDGIANSDNWVSATYKFKNIGKTEISSLEISTYLLRHTALFDVNDIPQIGENYLSYSVPLDKAIKPNETFTLRVNYMKDRIIGSATLTIWMQDVYGNYWAQSFFPHKGKLRDSRKEDWKTHRIYTQIDTALECFEKPWLW